MKLSKQKADEIATQHILGVTSLWLILPVYVSCENNTFCLLRLGLLVGATTASVIYWGYYNDENSIALHCI